MNYLDTNFLKFIEYFKNYNKLANISYTSSVLNISRRMIYYYIEKLNDLLTSKGLNKVHKDEQGAYILSIDQINCIDNKISSKAPVQFVFNQKERIELITLSILLENRKLYLKDFTDWFSISKNTVINDLKIVKKNFKKSNITLTSKRNKGYFSNVNEMLRRNLILKSLFELEKCSNKQLIYELLIFNAGPSVIDKYTKIFERSLKTLKSSEKILNKEISFSNRTLLAKTIAMIGIFRQSHNGIITKKQKHLIQKRLEYKAAIVIIDDLNNMITFEKNEYSYLAVLLLCVDKDTDFHFNSPTFKDILQISKKFIKEFETTSNVFVSNEGEFLKQLQTQMKVIYFRQLYNQVTLNDGVKIEDKQLSILYSIVKKLLKTMWTDGILKGTYKERLSDLDCYEIALIIQALILEDQLKINKTSTILVTDGSYTNNLILKAKIMNAFPNINIKKCVSIDESNDKNSNYDLCLTTLQNYRHPNVKTIFIHKQLDSKDYLELFKMKFVKNKEQIKAELASIISNNDLTISQKVDKIDEFYQLKYIEPIYYKEVSLAEACPKSNRYYFDEDIGITESLNKVKRTIKNMHILNNDQLNNISISRDNIEKYAFIFPEVLLIHANENNNETTTKVFICGYKYPIDILFNDNKRKVRYIIIMVSDIYMSHLNILLDLEEMIKNDKIIDFINE